MKHPSCSVCEGEEHHWLPDCEDENAYLKCKHCPETRDYEMDSDEEDMFYDIVDRSPTLLEQMTIDEIYQYIDKRSDDKE